MCMGSAPKAPTPPPALPEAPTAPDPSGDLGSADARRKSKAGVAGTILTGARGLSDTTTTGAGKTLLGS